MRTNLIITLLVILPIFSGCEHIEDTNGDLTDLQTISDSTFLGKTINFTTSGVNSSSTKNNFTTINMYDEIDLDKLTMNSGISSGISNIIATEVKEGDSFYFVASSKVEKGNFLMVLISPNNEIVYRFATNKKDTVTITEAEKGIYFIRIGAESFTGNVSVERFLDF